jgi:transcriptional regulator with XRE-family HTH domain
MNDPMAIMIGEVLERRRRMIQATQAELAELCSVETNYISMLERGDRKPGIVTLFKLAAAFNIKAWELTKEIEEKLEKNGYTPILKE